MYKNRQTQMNALAQYLAFQGFFSNVVGKPAYSQKKADKTKRELATKSRNRRLRKENHRRRMSR